MDDSEALTAYDGQARRDHAGFGEQVDVEADSNGKRLSRPAF